MTTFTDGESGLSVRTKINAVLQHTDGTSGELVVNDAGADVDFRVESDTNANALFVDGANGNVGLGTGTPTTRLSVYGPNSAIADAITKTVAIVDTRTAAAGTGGSLTFGGYYNGTSLVTEDFAIIAGIKENSTAGDYATAFTFATRGNGGAPAERMRITSGGNVGIGTGVNAPENRLDVRGVIQAKSSNDVASMGGLGTGIGYFQVYGAALAAIPMVFYTGTTEKMRIDSAGNVGIGTTVPLTKLDVFDGSLALRGTTYTSTSRISFGNPAHPLAAAFIQYVGNGDFSGYISIGTNASGNVAATEKIRIAPGGELLIGTTTGPAAVLLQVNSDARINGITVGRGAGAIASNTALGTSALGANTTGVNNVAVGVSALFSNTTGSGNVASGLSALYANTTGSFNIAVGRAVLQTNTTGNANTAVGDGALAGNTIGGNNTAVGLYALLGNTIGASNIGIGQGAGQSLTTGSNNTIIGSIVGTAALSNTIILGAGATERLRIDANGNMGLGVEPSAWGSAYKAVQLNYGSTYSAAFNMVGLAANSHTNGTNWIYNSSGQAVSRYEQLTGAHSWFTAAGGTAGATITFTQAMTLTATGRLGIGTTNPGGIFSVGEFSATGATQGLRMSDNGRLTDTSTIGSVFTPHYRFYNANGQVGSVATENSATVFTTSSDYRLKEDIQPVADATERLMELNPVNFAWKADGSRTDGFIAHEVQAVVPQAVTGEKDGDDMQQMDHSKLVPLLTAALQKAIQQIELLEARLDAANL